jgi:predicted bacteriocin transport accessory protein
MKDLLKSKTFLIIGSVFIILAAVAVTTYFALNPKIKTYKRINYTELNKLINSGERFILFIGSDSCSHCTIFKGTVDEVVEDYGVIVNYIDVSKLTSEEYAFLNAHLSFSGTPTTVLIDSGKESVEKRVLTKIRGSKSYDEFTNILKTYKFIKE